MTFVRPQRIHQARHAAGLTQSKVAAQIGVTQAAVSAWESGKATPGLENLHKLAVALGCQIDDLVGEEQAA